MVPRQRVARSVYGVWRFEAVRCFTRARHFLLFLQPTGKVFARSVPTKGGARRREEFGPEPTLMHGHYDISTVYSAILPEA